VNSPTVSSPRPLFCATNQPTNTTDRLVLDHQLATKMLGLNIATSTNVVGVLATATGSPCHRHRCKSPKSPMKKSPQQRIYGGKRALDTAVGAIARYITAMSFMSLIRFFAQITNLSPTPAPCSRPALAREARASWPYAASCFAFASVGLFQLISSPMLSDFHPLISWHFESYLFIFQSVLSYMSDVTTLGLASKWHPADRMLATSLGAHQVFKVGSLLPKIGARCLVGVAGCVIGGLFLRTGFKHWTKGSAHFINYHILWHMVFPVFVLGQYYAAIPALFTQDNPALLSLVQWLHSSST
jgi:hypothetical protein